MIALWAKASATMSKVRKEAEAGQALIGLDTNILLRATLNDDPVQSRAAQRLLKGLDEDESGFVNLPVLMEFFWVLRSRYKLPQARLAAVMRDLLGVEYIEFEALEVVEKALATYGAGIADFADMIIALRNRELGAARTFTFDESAAKSISGMELLA
jgi:predicted nucleic-acid-binding protein